MKKSLFILIDYADREKLDADLLKQCDLLAMTPSAMLFFEENGMQYMTFDDFYTYKEFRIDNSKLMSDTEDLFSILDKKYESFLNFPRAFTGNIYWFLIFFAKVHYISKICDRIKNKYDKRYLAGNESYKTDFKVEIKFSFRGITFNSFNNGLKNTVSILRAFLSPSCLWFKKASGKRFGAGVIRYRLLHSLNRKAKNIQTTLKSLLSKEKGPIFLIQDGYEVEFLKRYMRGYSYVKPIKRLLKMTQENEKKQDLKPLFGEEIDKFAERWFPTFKNHILELFRLYHREIICKLNFFSRETKELFKSTKPAALFYSTYANRIYEDVCAYTANTNDIPIFYFQHGGAATSAFCKHPYQKYLEHNKKIEKINIFQSKIERELFLKDVSPESRALGSIKLYDIYDKQKKEKRSEKKRNILYCTGPFTFYSYKDLMTNVSDKELFEVNKTIIKAVSKFSLEMDIKLSLLEESYYSLYFERVLKNIKSSNIRILSGFPAECIMNKYGLLIFSDLVTTLLPVAIILDTPVIAYLKDTSYMREETMSDIEKRFYIARNDEELDRYVKLYSEGKLKSKFCLDLVDKYTFPVDTGNPGINITDYIREKIDAF